MFVFAPSLFSIPSIFFRGWVDGPKSVVYIFFLYLCFYLFMYVCRAMYVELCMYVCVYGHHKYQVAEYGSTG